MSALAEPLAFFVQISGWLAVVLGGALLIAPRASLRLSAAFGRRDPLERAVAWLDQRRFVERFVYRHHRFFGLLVVIGAVYASYGLTEAALKADPATLSSLAWQGAMRFLWSANLLLVGVGAVIVLRPSALKGLEKWSNKWITVGLPRDVRQAGAARLTAWLHHQPRVAGGVLLMAGAYLVSFLTVH